MNENSPLKEQFLNLLRQSHPQGLGEIDVTELIERRRMFMAGAVGVLSILSREEDFWVARVRQELFAFQQSIQEGRA